MKIINKKINEIIKVTLEPFNPVLIYLFGSQAKGLSSAESDVDIAFFSEELFDDYDIFIAAQKISKEIKKNVDLVQLKKCSTVFQKEVLNGGNLLFSRDVLFKDIYEMTVIKKYIKLNEERSSIISYYRII